MAGSRKAGQRCSGSCNFKAVECTQSKPADPVKHTVLPPIPFTGCVTFHFFKFVFCFVATGLQYLNLYRTVWWLPKLKTKYAIDLDAIDANLFMHILLQLAFSPLFEFFQRLCWRVNTGFQSCLLFSLILFCFGGWICAQFYVIRAIHLEYFIISIRACGCLVLAYLPIACTIIHYSEPVQNLYRKALGLRKGEESTLQEVEALLKKIQDLCMGLNPMNVYQNLKQAIWSNQFWAKLSSQFLLVSRCPKRSFFFPALYATFPTSGCGSSGSSAGSVFFATVPSNSSTVARDNLTFYTARSYNRQMTVLRHNCFKLASDGAQVREEVDLLYQDFNARLTDALLGTTFGTFYSTILPWLFIKQVGLNYEFVWCLAHCVITALTLFLWHWLHLLPPAYLDLLHRSALHLGGWEFCPGVTYTNGLIQWQHWLQVQIYPKDVHVKHIRGHFRALEFSNAAEPGNVTHTRFYYWFHSPLFLPNLLCTLAFLLVVAQILCLEWVFEWYQLLAIATVSPFSLVNLYCQLRNRFLLSWLYGSGPVETIVESDGLTGPPSPFSGGSGRANTKTGNAANNSASSPTLKGSLRSSGKVDG